MLVFVQMQRIRDLVNERRHNEQERKRGLIVARTVVALVVTGRNEGVLLLSWLLRGRVSVLAVK